MASSFSTIVTRDEFHLFHKIDRTLYSLLVLTLHRDPFESMQVVALFIWLERKGFGFLVEKIISFPHILIDELAREAVRCLDYTNNIQRHIQCYQNQTDHQINQETGSCFVRSNLAPLSSKTHDLLPFMKSTLHQDLTLQFFLENYHKLHQGMDEIVDTVCIRALGDIMNLAIERRSHVTIPNMYPMSRFNHNESVPSDNRTVFITFSKGYPVQEWELRDFFTRNYGDCVESIYMQNVEPEEQSLFAKIVFRSFSIIGQILDATGRAKFSINGKHAWVRKFIPKRARVPKLYWISWCNICIR